MYVLDLIKCFPNSISDATALIHMKSDKSVRCIYYISISLKICCWIQHCILLITMKSVGIYGAQIFQLSDKDFCLFKSYLTLCGSFPKVCGKQVQLHW